MITNLLKNSLPTSFSVVNTYTADGDPYFSINNQEKFENKLIRYELSTKKVSVIDLPKEINVKWS